MTEQAICFLQGQHQLHGILHQPANTLQGAVVIVVGGPQTRIGSHRQFVLMARALAAAGFAVLRFDYRGMGDSEGQDIDFRRCGPDIGAAIDALLRHYPQAQRVALWGLCDAASAALLYAAGDPRVDRLMLLNPWVHTRKGQAETLLRHYYWQRLLSRQFWQKLLGRRVALRQALLQWWRHWRRTRDSGDDRADDSATGDEDYVAAMLAGWQRFEGRVLLILSGQDLTAAEFDQLSQTSPAWRRLLAESGVSRQRLLQANHTFSSAAWRRQVEDWCVDWLRGTRPADG